jgi:hypothetical protein
MIPKKIHFIFGLKEDFGGKPFHLVHYLAVKSAKDHNPDYEINYYYEHEASGEWWEKLKEIANLHKIKAPTEVFGNPIKHFAHRADVIRMQLLKDVGGIYLDMDTITKKSFDPLLTESFVIGQEGTRKNKLCNAIMFSEPGNRFITDWYEKYRDFHATGKHDATWGKFSIKLPAEMWKTGEYDDCLTVLPQTFFHYPHWDKKGSKMLFEECHDIVDIYAHHIWESFNWKYLSKLTPEIIKTVDTTYNVIARKHL